MFHHIEKLISNKKFKVIVSLLVGISFIIGLVLDVSDFRKIFKCEKDLSGSWRVENTVKNSSLSRYKGLKVSFDIVLLQDGNKVQGNGEKCAVDGCSLKPSERTKITFEGKLKNSQLFLTFTEYGSLRTTIGEMVLELDKDLNSFTGKFNSTAAGSSGISEGKRLTE